MQVAVCISGEFRNNRELCLDSVKKYLPYDTFTHTWDETPMPVLPSHQICLGAFDAWINTLEATNPTRIWFSKKLRKTDYRRRLYSIYNHWHCMQKVPQHYDMIVKVRPDVVLQDHTWQKDLENAYNNDQVYGYGSGQGTRVGAVDRFAADHIIMHRRSRMRNPYKQELVSSGHVTFWICLRSSDNEVFVNTDTACTLERDLNV